jgi:hypothetical protein
MLKELKWRAAWRFDIPIKDCPNRLRPARVRIDGKAANGTKQEEWLTLEVDFRTHGFGEIVTELPQLNQFLAT